MFTAAWYPSFQWRFSICVLLFLLLRLLWLLAETIMTLVAQTAPLEKPLMCMMDLPSVQVCTIHCATVMQLRTFQGSLLWQLVYFRLISFEHHNNFDKILYYLSWSVIDLPISSKF